MDRNDFVGRIRRRFSDSCGVATYTKGSPECWLGIVVCKEIIECLSMENEALVVEAAIARKESGEWVLSPLGRGKDVSNWDLFPRQPQELAEALCEYLTAYRKPFLGGVAIAMLNIEEWKRWARLWECAPKPLVARMARKKVYRTDDRFDLTLLASRRFYRAGFVLGYVDTIDAYRGRNLFPGKRAEVRDFLLNP